MNNLSFDTVHTESIMIHPDIFTKCLAFTFPSMPKVMSKQDCSEYHILPSIGVEPTSTDVRTRL